MKETNELQCEQCEHVAGAPVTLRMHVRSAHGEEVDDAPKPVKKAAKKK